MGEPNSPGEKHHNADSARRELPGHIAAALAGAGGPSDSAGVPWAGRSLAGDDAHIHNFEHDDGTTNAHLAQALESLRRGTGDEEAVMEALATSRVFIPVVATLAEEGEGHADTHSDKQADMAIVTIAAPDGRKALPVFSHVDALSKWHPEARPVATYAARAALSAVAEEAQLLVLDPGTDFTFVIRRAPMWALAQQRRWRAPYADPTVEAQFLASGLPFPEVVSVSVQRGSGVVSQDAQGNIVMGGGLGPELGVTVELLPALTQEKVNQIVGALQDGWARNETLAQCVDSIEVRLTALHP